MKKTIGRIVAIILFIAVLPTASAASAINIVKSQPEKVYIRYEITEAEIQEMIAQDFLEKTGINLNAKYESPYYTSVQYDKMEYVTASGFAGNQLPGGYNFPGGGALYWSDSGGPEVSVSVTFDLPWAGASVSIALGTRVASGGSGYVNVPADSHYYKLYVTRTYTALPYIIYYHDEPLHYGSINTPYSASLQAKRVS